jgi:hypothetical protein
VFLFEQKCSFPVPQYLSEALEPVINFKERHVLPECTKPA